VGANAQVAKHLIALAKYFELEVEEAKPLRKCWKGKDGKITAEELKMITGFAGRTNQDARDAALLAWWYAGLPIKMKTL
jgi:hypothetical protein